MSEVLTVAIRPKAKRCLLNVWEPTDLNTKHTTWATLGFMIAKRNIAQLWGAMQAPKIATWKENMDWCMFREKTVYVAQGCPKKWSMIWNSWNEYRGSICNPPFSPPPDDPTSL